MHAMRLLEKWLQRNAVIGHQAREHALVRVVDALLSGGRLALTHLGRHRAGSAFVKHHIKAVDRLLGNHHLHRERDGVYGALARTVLGGVARPVILVDWADSALAHKQLILKAAVPVKGRAISIYEEVHSMRCYRTRVLSLARPLMTFASDTCIPGSVSGNAVYRHTQRPRRGARSRGGIRGCVPVRGASHTTRLRGIRITIVSRAHARSIIAS